jgi:hypothetical protein
MSAFVDTSVWFAALGTNIFGRHQPGIMTKRCEFAAQVMCTDQASMPMRQRCVGGPHFHLATRPLLPAARWRRVHCGRRRGTISIPITAIAVLGVWHMATSMSLAPLASLSLAGQEHGRTISIVGVKVSQRAYSSGTPAKRRPS